MHNAMAAAARAEDREQVRRAYDAQATGELFARLNADLQRKTDEAKARAAALRQVQVADADVDVVAHELALTRDAARTKLQEHAGDVAATIRAQLYLG